MGALLVTLLLVPRPVLSGPELLLDTGSSVFLVHYTLSGADAPVDKTDVAPKNGVPDDIDAVAAGAAQVLNDYVGNDDMLAPLPDDGAGGDARIDIYVASLNGPRGYTYPDPPATPQSGSAMSAFIEVEPRTALVGASRLGAAAGHEMMHAMQYAYVTDLPRWIYEACAAYVEDSDFPDAAGIQDEVNAHFTDLLDNPAVPLDTFDGVHEYDEMVFAAFVTGSPEDLAALWVQLARLDDVIGALESVGWRGKPPEPIATLLVQFGSWLWSQCLDLPAETPNHWCTSTRAATEVGLGVVPNTLDVPLPPLAFNYVRLPPAGSCDTPFATLEDAAGVVYEVQSPSPMAAVVGADGGAVIEWSDSTLVVVARGPGSADAGADASITLAAALLDGGCPSSPDAGAYVSIDAPLRYGCACSLTRARTPSRTPECLAAIILAAFFSRKRRPSARRAAPAPSSRP